MLIHLYIVLAVVNKIYNMSNYLNLAKKTFPVMRKCFALFQRKNYLTARYVQFYAMRRKWMEDITLLISDFLISLRISLIFCWVSIFSWLKALIHLA